MNRGRLAATAFAVGSVCFAVAALPAVAAVIGAVAVNAVFVTGSVFFTAGAALSLGDPTWASSGIQLAGTLLFNVSTALALAAAVPAGAVGGTGWRPDVYGSACFLVSSILAVLATRTAAVRARAVSWLNVAGSVLFAAAAAGSFVLPGTDALLSPFWSGLGTVGGAVLFFLAALLGLRGPSSSAQKSPPG